MPNVSGLVISDLNATSTMPLQHCNIMYSRHRFDSSFFFLQPICTVNPEMNLSIDRRSIFENRWPVNIPICEDRPRIARNGDKTRWATKVRQFQTAAQSLWLLIFRERDDRFPGNVECLSRLHFLQIGSNRQKTNHRFLRLNLDCSKNPTSTCLGVFPRLFCRV